MIIKLLTASLLLGSTCFIHCESQHSQQLASMYSHAKEEQQEDLQAKGFVYVTKVIDGDTFWVDSGKEQFKVRFIGVDAPETRNTRWKQKGYYAAEAKAFVQRLTENKWVKLEKDVQLMDRYQRHLAYIYLQDGTLLNASLVKEGYAVVDTYPPNVKYVDLFVKLQHEAREKKLGLWAE